MLFIALSSRLRPAGKDDCVEEILREHEASVICTIADDAVAGLMVDGKILVYVIPGSVCGIRGQVEFTVVEEKPEPVERVVL